MFWVDIDILLLNCSTPHWSNSAAGNTTLDECHQTPKSFAKSPTGSIFSIEKDWLMDN
jgi:hypothetical protein